MPKLLLKIGFLFLFPMFALAAAGSGLGGVASNILDPIGVFSDFINSACLIIGGAFIFASLIKYIEHRRSPLMVTLGTVIFLFLAGILLLLLPLTTFISEGGFHYSVFRKG